MFNKTKVNEALSEIEKGNAGEPRLTEAQIEYILRTKIFRDALGFDEASIKHQKIILRTGHIIDIALVLDQSMTIVVEVKKYGELGDKNRIKHLRDKARYVRDINLDPHNMSQTFGILTDGINWIFFQVIPFGRYHRIYPLMEFNVKEDRTKIPQEEQTPQKYSDFTHNVFKRMQKSTMKRFLKALSAVHQNTSENEFFQVMDYSLDGRVDWYTKKAAKAGVSLSEDDKRVIRGFYEARRNTDRWLKLLKEKPLNLTKK